MPRLPSELSRAALISLSVFIVNATSIFALDIKGDIRDTDGLKIPNAEIVVRSGESVLARGTANGVGGFLVTTPASRTADLEVSAPGFDVFRKHLDIGARTSLAPMHVVLSIAVKRTAITVDATEGVQANSAGPGSLVLKGPDLASLPDDPDQLMKRLQFLAASSGGAPGSAVVQVDGFLNPTSLPSKSAIQEVRINPDQYAADYQRPPAMSGLIEVSTKASADGVEGSLFMNGSGSLLNARDALAPRRTPSDTTHYGFDLTGPVRPGKLSYSFNLDHRDVDEYSAIDAIGSNSGSVPSPQKLWMGSARLDWTPSDKNSVTATYSVNDQDLQNQDVGGLVDEDAGHRTTSWKGDLRIADTTVFSPSLLNQLRFGFYERRDTRDPNSTGPEIIVPGYFESGGSPLQSLRDQGHKFELNDVLSLNRKTHTVRAGVQVFRDYIHQLRTDNFNGTLQFDSLQQYLSGIPAVSTLTTGTPEVSLSQWQYAGFVQDEWRPSGRLAINTGVRYEGQTAPSVTGQWAPRFGIAYSLDKASRWVLRLRAGLFYRTLDESLLLDALRLNGITQTQIVSYAGQSPVQNVRELAPHLKPSESFQPQINLQHDFGHGMSLQTSFTLIRTWEELRSENVNAPLLDWGPRPRAPNENIFQYQSNGRVYGNIFYTGFNQSRFKHVTTFAGYIHMDFHSNADTPDLFPQNSYSAAGEWARPSWQAANRLYMGGVLLLPWKVESTFLFGAASGSPYDITTGFDNNGDGVFNDRPAITSASDPLAVRTGFGYLDPYTQFGTLPRNAATSPAVLTVDASVSRRFDVGKAIRDHRRALVLTLQGTNLTNHFNASNMIGVVGSPLFASPCVADSTRRIEAGVRFNF